MRSKRLQQNMILAERTLRQVKVEEQLGELLGRMGSDLRRRGIAPELSEPIAAQLCARADAGAISAEEYDALIEGAVAACAARERPDLEPDGDAGQEVREIERMMQAFAGELAKLDESLEVLSAYVQRMRKRPAAEFAERGSQTLH